MMNKIQNLRENVLKMTKQELSKALGVSLPLITRAENGENLTIDNFKKFERLLKKHDIHLDVSEFGGKNEKY